MAGYVEKLGNVIATELDRLATQIEGELKSAVSSKVGKKSSRSTGAAEASIHVEKDSPITRFIGANINWGDHNDGGVHLYYFDQGNSANGSDGRIHPTRSRKGLHLKHIGNGVWASSVSTYKGSGVVKEVADRHR